MKTVKITIKPSENRELTKVIYADGKLVGVELFCPHLYGGTKQYLKISDDHKMWTRATHAQIWGDPKKLDIYHIPNETGTMEFPVEKEPLNLPRTGYGFTLAQTDW